MANIVQKAVSLVSYIIPGALNLPLLSYLASVHLSAPSRIRSSTMLDVLKKV